MTKDKFYLWLFYLLPLVYFFSLPIATGDLAVWVAQGKYMLSTHTILRNDIYSVLPTSGLVYPVLTCLIYALIYGISGLIGVSVFHKLILVIIHVCWANSFKEKIRPQWGAPALVLILASWFGSSMFWVERPAFLGMLLLLISYLILEKDKDKQKENELNFKDWTLLILINVLWVNVHGSWIILTAMIVWREFWRVVLLKSGFRWQHIVATLVLLASSLINPFGYKVFSYLFETTSISLERHIDEWAPPSLHGGYPSQALSFFLLAAFFIFYFFRSNSAHKKRIFASPFCLIFLMGFISIRNTALPFFLLIPFAVKYILQDESSPDPKVQQKKSFINLVIIGTVVLLCLLFFPTIKPKFQNSLPESKRALYDSSAPIVFAQKLNETNDSDPVFNEWEYGSYLILAQKHPIFIDTRNIIYGRKEYDEYKSVMMAQKDWEQILLKYKVRYMLLSKRLRKELIMTVEKNKSWKKLIEDENTVLFERA